MAALAAAVPASDAAGPSTVTAGRRSRLLPDRPYPGIRPFIKDEWPIFCGRQRIVDELLEVMVKDQFVPVLGTSGCGKSSIVKAGLIATLEREYSALGAAWRSAEMRPGNTPMWCLAEALWSATHPDKSATATPEQLAELRALLGRGPDGIDRVLKEYGFPKDLNLLLLVDQFEELFRFGVLGGEAETRTFLDQLLDVYENQTPGIHIVLTMRTDFISDCARWPRLAMALNKTAYLLRWMTNDELREAIAAPALLYRGKVEPELVERIIRDAGGNQDQLPVIEHALMWMWDRVGKTSGAVLTLADYLSPEVGGIDGALSHHADQIYESLARSEVGQGSPPRDLRWVAQRLFQALTDVDAGGRVIRRPCPFGDLSATIACQPAELLHVINAFRKAGCSFLMPAENTQIKDTDRIDVSHEALIRQWSKMKKTEGAKGWLEEERQDAEAWRSLANEAGTFHDDKSYRLSARQTKRFDAWWTRRKPSNSWTARYSPSGDSQFKDAAALLHLSASRQRLVKAGSVFLAVLVGASLLSTGVLLVIDSQHRAADLVLSNKDLTNVLESSKTAMTSTALKAANEWRSTDALVLARTAIKAQYALGRQAGDQLTADRLYPPIAEGVAYKALARHFLSGRYSIGNAWDWTADGKIIVSADVRAGRHEVQLINATTGEPIDMFARDEDSIYNLDISPDAQRIAVSNEKPKVVEILDANGGKPIKTLDGWEGASNLFFSPDNRWLAMSDGGHFGVVDTQSWNVKTWNGSIPPGNLVFSSNSLYVAFVSDSGQPTVVSLGDEVSSYQGDAGPIGGSPVFVPTRTILAVPFTDESSNGQVRFVDFGKKTEWRLDLGNDILPTALAFDGTGQRLVVATDSGELRVLRAFSEQSSSTPPPWEKLGSVSGGTPTALQFFPDGSAILVHTYGGLATIFDSQSGTPRGTLYGSGDNYMTTFSDDGQQIVMDNVPTVGVWRSTPALAPEPIAIPSKNSFVARSTTMDRGDATPRVGGIVYEGNSVAGILADTGEKIAIHRVDDSSPRIISQVPGSGRAIVSTNLNASAIGIVDDHWDVWTMAVTADRPTKLGTLEPSPQSRLAIGSGVDGSVIALSDTGTARYFSAEGKTAAMEFDIEAKDRVLTIDADRRRLLVVRDDGRSLAIWVIGVSGMEEPVNLPLPDPSIWPLPFAGTFSQDGHFAAIVQDDGIVNVWDINRRALVALTDVPKQIPVALSFSPQGDKLDVVAWDGSIDRWPLFPNTGKLEDAISAALPKGLEEKEMKQMLNTAPGAGN